MGIKGKKMDGVTSLLFTFSSVYMLLLVDSCFSSLIMNLKKHGMLPQMRVISLTDLTV